MKPLKPCNWCSKPKSRGRGLKLCPSCTEASRSAHVNRHEVLRDYVQARKAAIGCVDCGYSERPEALDWDHVRGVKVASLGAMVAGLATIEELDAEMAKCEVRCANCHRIRTADRRQIGKRRD